MHIELHLCAHFLRSGTLNIRLFPTFFPIVLSDENHFAVKIHTQLQLRSVFLSVSFPYVAFVAALTVICFPFVIWYSIYDIFRIGFLDLPLRSNQHFPCHSPQSSRYQFVSRLLYRIFYAFLVFYLFLAIWFSFLISLPTLSFSVAVFLCLLIVAVSAFFLPSTLAIVTQAARTGRNP